MNRLIHYLLHESSAEAADMNRDGFADIITANGDNGDFSLPLKGYHGIRFYETFGDFAFIMKARVEGIRALVVKLTMHEQERLLVHRPGAEQDMLEEPVVIVLAHT